MAKKEEVKDEFEILSRNYAVTVKGNGAGAPYRTYPVGDTHGANAAVFHDKLGSGPRACTVSLVGIMETAVYWDLTKYEGPVTMGKLQSEGCKMLGEVILRMERRGAKIINKPGAEGALDFDEDLRDYEVEAYKRAIRTKKEREAEVKAAAAFVGKKTTAPRHQPATF